jgi:hypothetical protein
MERIEKTNEAFKTKSTNTFVDSIGLEDFFAYPKKNCVLINK